MTGKDKRGSNSESEDVRTTSDSGETSLDGRDIQETQNFQPSSGMSGPAAGQEPEMPKSLGRYEVRELLGRGGFGAVYIGHDPKLNRQVAIKVPHLRDDVGDVEDIMASSQSTMWGSTRAAATLSRSSYRGKDWTSG
jgi:serine/threonine protein kinase